MSEKLKTPDADAGKPREYITPVPSVGAEATLRS
jgi:hypothetical protein